VRLRFLGHAAFDLTLAGTRLCLDPHRPGALGGRFALPPIVGPFDAVVCTHRHEDHAGWTPALGTEQILDRAGSFGPLQLDVRAAVHDTAGGTRAGLTRMVSIRGDGLRVVHAGDIAQWTPDDVAWLRGADVLLIPAGGTYTMDGAQAAALAREVGARWTVPMHCRDARIDLPLADVADFAAAWGEPLHRAAVLETTTPPGAVLLDAP
jgi:L-ascorbate metabolism protein UlaG (beta-lactamase superfamily)